MNEPAAVREQTFFAHGRATCEHHVFATRRRPALYGKVQIDNAQCTSETLIASATMFLRSRAHGPPRNLSQVTKRNSLRSRGQGHRWDIERKLHLGKTWILCEAAAMPLCNIAMRLAGSTPFGFVTVGTLMRLVERTFKISKMLQCIDDKSFPDSS